MSLVDKINKAANEVAKNGRRGVGNYMIVNSSVASILNKIKIKNKIRKIFGF